MREDEGREEGVREGGDHHNMPCSPIPSHNSPTMPTTCPTHQSLYTPHPKRPSHGGGGREEGEKEVGGREEEERKEGW